MTTGFHAKNGWFFERVSDGDVQIKFVPQIPEESLDAATKLLGALLNVTVDADTWASIVASVSGDGEDARTFAAASLLHKGSVK